MLRCANTLPVPTLVPRAEGVHSQATACRPHLERRLSPRRPRQRRQARLRLQARRRAHHAVVRGQRLHRAQQPVARGRPVAAARVPQLRSAARLRLQARQRAARGGQARHLAAGGGSCAAASSGGSISGGVSGACAVGLQDPVARRVRRQGTWQACALCRTLKHCTRCLVHTQAHAPARPPAAAAQASARQRLMGSPQRTRCIPAPQGRLSSQVRAVLAPHTRCRCCRVTRAAAQHEALGPCRVRHLRVGQLGRARPAASLQRSAGATGPRRRAGAGHRHRCPLVPASAGACAARPGRPPAAPRPPQHPRAPGAVLAGWRTARERCRQRATGAQHAQEGVLPSTHQATATPRTPQSSSGSVAPRTHLGVAPLLLLLVQGLAPRSLGAPPAPGLRGLQRLPRARRVAPLRQALQSPGLTRTGLWAGGAQVQRAARGLRPRVRACVQCSETLAGGI